MTDVLEIPIEPCIDVMQTHERDTVAKFAQNYPTETTISVPYHSVYTASEDLAHDLQVDPELVLERLKHGLNEVDLPYKPSDNFEDARVGVSGVKPDIGVDEIREEYIGQYIGIRGRVAEITQVKPEVTIAAFRCRQCKTMNYVESIGDEITAPDKCQSCDEWAVFEFDHREVAGTDKQIIELSTLPEETGADTTSSIRVEVENDLVGQVNPGDTVRMNGILKYQVEEVTPGEDIDSLQDVYLDCRAIDSEQQTFDEFETNRIDEIEDLSEREDLFKALIQSFAPHILTDEYGDMQKLGMVLQQFGGVRRNLPNGTEKRRDINILLVGDPGTAKSQYLHTANHIAPKSMKASGKGATAAGLTATAEQSELTGSWTLKAGALVLANNGLACIDEFDKMADGARKSMHEALEDQEIPINKAGINTTLPAKCSVLAAANPENGRYDRMVPMSDQVDLEPPLIQRFDLIFGIMDQPDDETDKQVVKHQLAFGDDKQDPEIETELLREYIAYARQRVKPSWDSNQPIKERVADYYLQLRNDSEGENGAIGPRVNDAIRRLAEASARARLSDTVALQDIERATDLMNYHIGQVAIGESGEISGEQFDGSYSKKEEKARQERIEQIQSEFGNQTVVVSDVVGELREDRSRVESDLSKMVENGQADKVANGRYEIKEVA